MISKMPGLYRSINITVLVVVGFFLSVQYAYSQKVAARAAYIEKYTNLAVDEMKKSGIPASITMAQAILESNLGKSDLATVANNHFGIKCHVGWEGGKFYYDDDEEDECFRVYDNAEGSFTDHSIFLMTRERYRGLFDLDPFDYKGWAKGLKAAGYATNPKYAGLLIKIIEEEQLYQLDNYMPPAISRNSTGEELFVPDGRIEHKPGYYDLPKYKRNRIDFVVSEKGETIESLTDKLGLLRWEIRKYNELNKNGQIEIGTLIYIQPKRKRAAKGFKKHIVREGETIYSISQHYGIKTKWILKRNSLLENARLRDGQQIWLRGRNRKK